MNVNARKMDEYAIKRPIFEYVPKISVRSFLYRMGIVVAGALCVFLLVLLKSKTTIDYRLEPVFFFYAIFVTTFELSRIVSASM